SPIAQFLDQPLHLRSQKLVLLLPPLGLGAGGVKLLLQRLDAVQQRQGGLNDAPLIRTQRDLHGDATQLLQAVRYQVSHHASPRTLASTVRRRSMASTSKSSSSRSGPQFSSANSALSAASISSRTTPASKASVGMPSQA